MKILQDNNYKEALVRKCIIWLSISVFALLANSLQAQNNSYQDYIDRYKEIAISEMERTGIPASIKLAQGILESSGGKSELARQANNHFGIKCGSSWKGGTYHLKDDDYRNGRLIKSCFRSYQDGEESFVEHSEFLRDPKKAHRYGFLFNIPMTDYKSWAHGLRKAGYATNRKYASLLIRIIEQNNLAQYDTPFAYKEAEIAESETFTPEILVVNDVQYVIARTGETPQDIAHDFAITAGRIISYNESIYGEDQSLTAGERVYLQKKRSNFRGRKKYHYVKPGETMFTIAQLYGLRMKKLVSKNKLSLGEEPAIGEKVIIRGWNLFGDAPILRSKQKNVLPAAPSGNMPQDADLEPGNEGSEIQFPEAQKHEEELPSPKIISKGEEERQLQSNMKLQEENRVQPATHITVKKGDTLYGISRKYNMTVKELKELNKLQTSVIQPGQVLKVKAQ